MSLISWTLQSGSEQFIYNWNQDIADLEQEAETSKKERTKQQRIASINGCEGIKVVSKSHMQTVKTKKILTKE